MPDPPQVVVVGHDASRSGAPAVLLTFLRWLRHHHPRASPTVVLLAGGQLMGDHLALGAGPVGRWRPAARRAVAALPAGTPAPVVAALSWAAERAALGGRLGHAAVVVANTLAALGPAAAAVHPDQRLVVWVHELDGVADRVLPRGDRRAGVLARVDRFVAAGPAVADMLTDRWGLPTGLVEVVPPFVDDPRPSPVAVADARRRAAGGDPDRPVVLGVGARGPRKGTDRFVDLAVAVDRLGVAASWAWLGGDPASTAGAELGADVAAVDRPWLRALVEQADALAFLAAADLHLSPAREDPFPLSVLEAAAAGTAVAGFDAGGLGALLRAAAVPVPAAPVGDLLGLARDVAALLVAPAALADQAAALSAHVRAHHLTDTVAPALWESWTRW